MPFEYDLNKSAANKDKHGIDFDEARALWRDPWLLEAPAKTVDEPRFIVIGKIPREALGRNLHSSWRQCSNNLGTPRPEARDRAL